MCLVSNVMYLVSCVDCKDCLCTSPFPDIKILLVVSGFINKFISRKVFIPPQLNFLRCCTLNKKITFKLSLRYLSAMRNIEFVCEIVTESQLACETAEVSDV